MRTINPTLLQHFKDGFRAVIIKVTCKDGTIYGYTDHDMPLTVGGVVYVPAPGLQRMNLTSTVNDSVSNQEFAAGWVVDAGPEVDLLAGKLDNAAVEVSFCSWKDVSLGKMSVDRGNLGVIQWTADGFRADMQSHMRQLQRNIGFTYTANCRHALFNQFAADRIGACTLNEASYTYTGVVSTVLTPKLKFSVTGLSQVSGWCTNGVLTWVTGANAGLKTEVKGHVVSATTDIEFFLPAFRNIVIGDQFSITAGCDKTHETCKTKFNNVINFGGFKFIQTEVQYR